MENIADVNDVPQANPPVPTPRPRHKVPVKPSPPTKLNTDSNTNAVKPPVHAKPKIAPKPSIAPKPTKGTLSTTHRHSSDVDQLTATEPSRINRKTRPLSVKVTDDGVHNKVANELTSIFGRPRSVSKGLLSPTDYSTEQQTDQPIAAHQTSPVSHSPPTSSPPKPVPRARHSITSPDVDVTHVGKGIPTADTHVPRARQSIPKPDADVSEVIQNSSTTATNENIATGARSNPVSPTAAHSDSSTQANVNDGLTPAADKNVKKPRPARPPPPSVKRPPPPQRPPAVPSPASVQDKRGVNERSDDSVKLPTAGTEGSQEIKPVQKKLEITVLGARPMSEVGFRGEGGIKSVPHKVVTDTESSSNATNGVTEKAKPEPPPQQQVSTNMHAAATVGIALKASNDISSKPPVPSSSPMPAVNAGPRKPTIIRPERRPNPSTQSNSDTDSLVSKGSAKTAGASDTGSLPKPQSTGAGVSASPVAQRKDPPTSLPVKKDPWNQIAKGPGPTDNLAFSTGDTPPPRSQGLTLLSVVTSQPKEQGTENTNDTSHHTKVLSNSDTEHSSSSKSHSTIMDQSLENTLSEVLKPTSTTSPELDTASAADKQTDPGTFYPNVSADSTQMTSKPSALQRIYEYKKAREEKQPDKYKHRPDCYLDKPNNDAGFWKPSPHSTDDESTSPDTKSSVTNGLNKGSKSQALVAYAAFAYVGTEPTDLSLKAGQEVKVIAKLSSEWLYGEADGKFGEFPALYVSVSEEDIEELPLRKPSNASAKTSDSSTNGGALGTALYDFTAEHDTEMSIKVGDQIINVEPVDGEWSTGRIGKRCGMFPTSFIELQT